MKVEVEVTSKETIKPSSPIPDHPHTYDFSFLDQISPKVYSPVIFYYRKDQYHPNLDISEISDKLKNSLSDVLAVFYPLAGRVKADRSVDCNDAGIPFFEAQVKCRLSDVLGDPNPNELCHLLPFRLYDVTELALGIQLKVFQCGGIAIGLCISHQIADAYSVVMFVKSWVASANGEGTLVRPEFTAAVLFPPRDKIGYDPSNGIKRQGLVTKRFVFDSSALKTLRERHESRRSSSEHNSDVESYRPTRVELLSAFIWSRFSASDVDGAQNEKFYTVIHAVNLRPRFSPPLPEERSFGNMFRLGLVFLSSTASASSLEESSYGLIRKIREGIRRVDSAYVEKVLQQGSLVDVAFVKDRARRLMERGDVIVTLSFSSLSRFPLYEVDFGWGQPTWVGSTAIPFENSVGFMDSKEEDGIEAYITLNEQAMCKFEVDKDFCELVCNPRVS